MTKLRPPIPFKRRGRGQLPGQSDYGLDDVINIKVKDTTTHTIINRELVQVGNIGAGKYVEIDDTGINLYANSLEKISIETDGDLFLGTDLSAADTTHLAIFANNQTYNSESLGVGDLLLGSNSASKPNVLWDASAGDMKFRIGTTDNISIASTGTLIVQGSEIKIDNQTDGDLFIGRDTSDPDKTALAVFATGQTYNSESMGAGDVLIGSNSAGQHNIYWDDSTGTFYLRQGTTSRIEMDSSTIHLGDSGTENILISSSYLRIRDSSTIYSELSSGIFTIGRTSDEHIRIGGTTLQLKDGSTIYTALSAGSLTLGPTTQENIILTASELQMRSGGVVYTELASGTLKLGLQTADHVQVTTSGIQMKDNTTVRGEWQTDGDIFIGRDISDPDKTAFSVFAQAQTYNSESMGAGDVMLGSNSATQHNLLWDDSTGEWQLRRGTDVYIEMDGALLYLGDQSGENILLSAASGISFREGSTSHAQLTSSTLRLGQTAQENILISSASGVNIRESGTSYAQLTGSALRLGQSSAENIRITGGTLQIRDSSTVYTELSSSELIVGRSGNENIRLTGSEMQIRDSSTVYSELSSGIWTIGRTSQEHMRLSGSSLQLKDSSTIYTSLGSGEIVVGPTTNENIRITTSEFQIRDASTVYTELSSGTITVGRTSSDHVEIASNAVRIKDGSTVKGEWQTDGDIFIGNNISNPDDTYLAIFAGAQTYNSEGMGAGDMLIGDNSSSKANILWDKSAAQLKFRGGTSTELYIDTDGSLTAGAGDVILNSDGITLAAGSGTPNQYKIDDSSDNIFRVYSSVSSNTSNAFLISTGKNSSNHEALFQLKAITDDGSAHAGTAAVTLTGDTNTGWITLSCDVLSIPQVLRLTGLSSATISGLSPSNGWMVYNSSTNKFQGYAAGSWQDFH